KIKVIQDNNMIRVYHSPKEVVVKPVAKRVELYSSNGNLIEAYELKNKNLSWFEDKDIDNSEIILTLEVGKKIFEENSFSLTSDKN
ncbi:MAG: hypothetical protein OEM18_06165, partial [Nitrosopumilus sp.]|nr:hypothetical protein [Nitrosopumilus sp.]